MGFLPEKPGYGTAAQWKGATRMNATVCASGLLTVFACVSLLHAAATTGAETVDIGDLYTSNWRSGDFSGTALRTWNAAGDSFSFTWSTTAGDQIGRIGKSHDSDGFGVRVDGMRDNCVMSTDGEIRNLVTGPAGFYMFAIYGWTHEQNSGWPSPNGWNNEFYVIFQHQLNLGPGSGNTTIGSVTVDGAVFDCYTNDMPWGTPNQTQWLAVARDHAWNASVDLKQVFAYWRTQGLPDEYVVDLTWALEAGPGSRGELYLSRGYHTGDQPGVSGIARSLPGRSRRNRRAVILPA